MRDKISIGYPPFYALFTGLGKQYGTYEPTKCSSRSVTGDSFNSLKSDLLSVKLV